MNQHTPEGYPDYDPESKTWTVGQADSSGTLSWDEAMYLPDDTVPNQPNGMADRTEVYLRPPTDTPQPSRRSVNPTSVSDPTAHSPYQMTHSGARTYRDSDMDTAFALGIVVGCVFTLILLALILL
jgi:hypothetical protein